MSDRPLFQIRDSRSIPRTLWQRFIEKAAAEGLPPGPALGRLIRRYLGEPDDDQQSDQTRDQ